MPRIFVLILGALATLPTFAQTIERPAVKVGDECHFDVFDNLRKDGQGEPEKIAERHSVVTSAEGDRILVNWTQKILVTRDTGDLQEGVFVYDRDLNLVEGNGRKYEPAYPSRFYPVTPGAEKKDAKTSFPFPLASTTYVTFDGKASSWQTIAVPAGKFDVVTLIWKGGWHFQRVFGGGSKRLFSDVIYQDISLSPTTGCLVKGVYRVYGGGGISSDRTYKLTSFKH